MSRFVLTAQLQLQAPNNVRQVVQQIQQQLQGVTVNVQVQNAAQAQRQIQQVTQATNQATTAAERMGKAFALSVRRFAAFSVATRAVSLFTNTLGDAVQSAIDFERQLIKVSQVTGKSIGQLRGLTKQITGLATGFGVASSDLLEVSTVLAQAGLSAEDTAVALKTLAKAALAPNFDSITETAEGAIAILAQFGQGVESLESQLGSINAVAGAFAVEASDLIDVIRRTGGVFKASGGSLNELLALFTSVRATTRESAESIGTGLRTIFTRIQRPKTIEFLKQFGVELTDLNGKFVGPYEAIRRLSEALSGLGEGDITFIQVAEELGGFRQIGKVLPLLQQYSTSQAALNVAMKANNSLSDDAASAQAALAIRIMKVKEEFLALIRSVTETSTFQIMANTALSLASALIKIGDAIKPLLPMLAALAAIKLAKGLGGFFGGMMSGATSGRQYNKGGKVLGFARGGLVPGTGNRDTVPAMLSPGEFVIRKSSVNKMGAGTLAAMNENRYAAGGIARQNSAGMAVGDLLNNQKPDTATAISGSASVNARSVLTATPGIPPLGNSSLLQRYSGNAPKGQLDAIMSQALGFSSKNYQTKAEGVTKDEYQAFNNALGPAIENAVIQSAGQLAHSMGVVGASPPTFTEDFRKSLPKGLIGSLFEIILDSFNDKPISGSESRRPFDFIGGIRPIGSMYRNLAGINYVDAKVSPGHRGTNISSDEFTKKINNQLALDVFDDYVRLITNQQELMGPISAEKSAMPRTVDFFKGKKAYFGGLIQKFAVGGIASAPLVDDILSNASGSLLPRPSSAIASLIKAGGGAIDLDRTLKRTIGDKAYAGAKTGAAKDAVLSKYFKDDAARLNDIKSAPLTTFGKELQAAIKSGQLSPGKLSIISKSSRTRGVPEYLSQLLGIPISNMIFTGGGSKQPAMDALRSKGPRSNRVARFATGGGVGTDTVPALLTPGEFVINRKSAQTIGYGALNRMNKVGKYAQGGVVQRFATGGGVTSKSVKSDIAGLSGNQSIQQEIAATAQEIKKTGEYAKRVSVSLDKQAKVTDALYQQSSALDARISNYDKVLANLAAQQGKAAATGPAANRIVQMKIDAESQRIEVDKKAMAEEQKLEGIKKKHADTLEKQIQLIDKQNSLIQQARSNKKAATQIVNQDLTARNSAGIARSQQEQEEKLRRRQERKQSVRSSSSFGGGSMMPKDIGGAAIAISMVTASLQAMLPPLDENASTLTKLSHSFLGMITTLSGVVFALQSFGVALSAKSIMDFLGGKGLGANGIQSVFNTVKNMGGSTNLAGSIAGVVNGLSKVAGPALLVSGAFIALNSVVQSVADGYKKESERQIAAGSVEEAGSNARAGSGLSFASTAGTVGGIIGSIVGGAAAAYGTLGMGTLAGSAVGGGIGSAAGTGIGLMIDRLSGVTEQAGILAEAKAGEVKASKEMEKANHSASSAMKDFKNGTKTALDVLKAYSPAMAEQKAQRERTDKAVSGGIRDKVGGIGGFFRGAARIGTLGLAGFAGLESGSQYNTRTSKETTDLAKSRREAESKTFSDTSEARNAAMRSGIARGLSKKQVESQLKSQGFDTSGDLLSRSFKVRAQARAAKASGDTNLETELNATADMLEQQSKDMENAFKNIELEVKRAKDSFEAMNLGLRSAEATATALSAGMDRFSSGLEVGGSTFVSDVEFLQQSLSSAAQAMDPADIKSAMKNVSANLSEMGVSPQMVAKFEGNVSAFTQAQANYNKAFENVKKSIADADFKNLSPDQLKKKMADELTKGMGPDVSEDAKKNLKAVIEGMELNTEDVDKVLAGDLSVFGNKLSEAQKKMFEDIQKIAAERAKAEQVLIDFTKKRIDAERNLVQAQQEALDLTMEGREIQSKYGGAAVTMTEKRDNLLAKSNVEGNRLGLSSMRTGDAVELRRRNAEISNRFSAIEDRRTQQGGMQRKGGVEADEAQKDLQKAYKTQIDTIRGLIKLEEEQLKILQEKNKLEKDSMESLVKGDIEAFFKQQAAVGATAAIASGDQRLMNYYGSEALGTAALDIQRQQEAGVQELYGQQLGGVGGLTERAAGAALSARGVTDMRAAQVMAGTTAEEEASKARLRELGGMLGETGQLGVEMAEMQVQTATINVNSAQLKFNETIDRGNKAAEEANRAEGMPAVARARGGLIYASRGIFVPRGTDTVPAMLTPGEFVINRAAVNRGNNLQILQAINNGSNVSSSSTNNGIAMMSGGGKVRYYADGDQVTGGGGMFDSMSNFVTALTRFGSSLSESITKLSQTSISIKLDSTAVNINLNDGGLLKALTGQVKTELFKLIESEFKVDEGGKLRRNSSVLGR